jgi:tetrahydromethanopterin S-methyltransferase subunit G
VGYSTAASGLAEPPRAAQGLGNLPGVADQRDIEARLAAVEARVEEGAADAAAARHLAAARDRDLAELGVKVDANRRVINALAEQTAARFDQVDRRFDEVDQRFDRLENEVDRRFDEVDQRFDRLENEMRFRFDQTAAGHQRIVDLLTGLINRPDEP